MAFTISEKDELSSAYSHEAKTQLAQWIRSQNHVIETDMDNLVYKCFYFYDGFLEDDDELAQELSELPYVKGCIEFIQSSGGLIMFDA